MRNLFTDINHWQAQGKSVALATVVKVYGSAPRPLGAKMAVSSSGDMVGSVSGGCVESAVLQHALDVIDHGRPQLIEFGIADELAQGIGLACGGNIEVFIEPVAFDKQFEQLKNSLMTEQLVAVATLLAGSDPGAKLLVWPDERTLGDFSLDGLSQGVRDQALGLLTQQKTERRSFMQGDEEQDVFFEVYVPRPRLFIIGAVHIAIPLVTFAKAMGFHTTVVDARSAFATPERFTYADQLILEWPEDALNRLPLNEASYIAVLSHDDKLDVPALRVALDSPARYIGALGSRKTMAKRAQKLRADGISDGQLARIYNPIGLDLGGRRPEEIALAIMGEIVSVRNGKT